MNIKIGDKFKSIQAHDYDTIRTMDSTTSTGKSFTGGWVASDFGQIAGTVVGYSGDGWVCLEGILGHPYFITPKVFETMNKIKRK